MTARTVDMSPAAVTRRVREVAELYEVGMHLTKTKRRGPPPPTVRQGPRTKRP